MSVVNSSGLTHAIYASGTWLREVVDPSARGEASLVLDAANKGHIAYFASTSLRYATNTSGAWTNIVIEEFGRLVRGSVSLSVDAFGNTHIAYSGIDNILKYATNQGGHGRFPPSAHNEPLGYLWLLTPRGAVHIVYAEDTNYQLYYPLNMSGTWSSEIISSSGYFPSLSLDAAGKAHVIYVNTGPYGVRYASNSSGTWRVATLESGDYPVNPEDMDIALDSLRKARISCSSQEGLRYATNK